MKIPVTKAACIICSCSVQGCNNRAKLQRVVCGKLLWYLLCYKPHLHDAHALEPADAPRLALQRAVAVAQRASVIPAPGPNLALCIDCQRVAAAGDERRAWEAAPGLRTGCVGVCEQLPP